MKCLISDFLNEFSLLLMEFSWGKHERILMLSAGPLGSHQHLLQLALDNTFQVFWEGLWLYFHGKTFLRITNNNSLFFILKSKIIILKHNNILIKPFLCFLFFFFLHLWRTTNIHFNLLLGRILHHLFSALKGVS